MVIGYILLVIALVEFILGLWFIFRYQKSQATIWFGLFCIGSSIYVGGNGIGFVIDNVSFAERIGWAGGALATTFFLPFSYTFPIARRTVRELLPWVLWPTIFFCFGSLFTDLIVEDIGLISYRVGYRTADGPYFWTFLVFFAVYWIWALWNLAFTIRKSDGYHRWQAKMVITGIIASLIVSTIFDITLPLITVSHFGYVGSFFTSIWLGFTSYILLKR